MNRYVGAAGVAVAQLALTAVAVAPQLSARLTGDTYLMRVAPLDPIDPFRGAYVTLDYPDLRPDEEPLPGEGDTIYVALVEDDGLMVASDWSRTRPEDGVYLACRDEGWQLGCGIESWFVPQDEARGIEETLADSGAVAELRVDGRGNAAIVGLRTG
jgi:uncharacterized membrane-anchored protein